MEVNTILDKLSVLQYSFLPEGIFPSSRLNNFWKYKRADSNIFATASIAFILKGICKYLNNQQVNQIHVLLNKSSGVFEKYRNMHGGTTYNFWQTNPSLHFPNGRLLKYFKHFKLPDDIDDTALIYLVLGKTKSEVELLREKVIKHSKPFKKEESYAYNTWFGEKMPQENDVCALCNLLYLFLESGIEIDDTSSATLDFIAESIESLDFVTKPFNIARHYASTPLVIYHYARLMGRFEIPVLQKQKSLLISQTLELFENEKNKMNKLLLHTSLIRLGKRVPIDTNEEELLSSEFYPFIGAPFAPFSNFISKKIASKPWAIINWECEALKLAYILENQVLSVHY